MSRNLQLLASLLASGQIIGFEESSKCTREDWEALQRIQKKDELRRKARQEEGRVRIDAAEAKRERRRQRNIRLQEGKK